MYKVSRTHISVYAHIYICIYIYMCICVNMYMLILGTCTHAFPSTRIADLALLRKPRGPRESSMSTEELTHTMKKR